MPEESFAEVASNQDIPLIPLDRVHVSNQMGSGMTADVYAVNVDGISIPAILKTPKLNTEAQTEVRIEAEVLAHLNRKGVKGIPKTLGFSPDMQAKPYIIKEFVSGLGKEFRHEGNIFIPSQKGLLSPNGDIEAGAPSPAERKLRKWRAEWLYGLLNDVLTPVHEAGVVISDFKPDDYILGEDGVKAIDFGNAYQIGKEKSQITSEGGTNMPTDCEAFFDAILNYGFFLPTIKDTLKHVSGRDDLRPAALDGWLTELHSRDAHPALIQVAQTYADYYKQPGLKIDDNRNLPFKKGSELAKALQPLFETMGVADGFLASKTPDVKPQSQSGELSNQELLALTQKRLQILERIARFFLNPISVPSGVSVGQKRP